MNATPNSNVTARRLKQALLAGTCIGGATIAQAQVFNESTDLPNTVAGAVASPLPLGTRTVNGAVAAGTDPHDFLAFSSLLAGSAFSITLSGGNYLNFEVFDSASLHLGSPGTVQTGSTPLTFTGTVPNDGILVADVGYNEGTTYAVNLTASAAVPEPEETAAVMLGVAGVAAAAMRRARGGSASK